MIKPLFHLGDDEIRWYLLNLAIARKTAKAYVDYIVDRLGNRIEYVGTVNNIVDWTIQFQETLIRDKAIQEGRFVFDMDKIINSYNRKAKPINNIDEAINFFIELNKRINEDIDSKKLPVEDWTYSLAIRFRHLAKYLEEIKG